MKGGYNIIILSDRLVGPDRAPIPALLATAAVHHHLIRKGLRTSVGLVVETGEAREVHHFACLAGYGAEAINPYLAFETIAAMAADLPGDVTPAKGVERFIKSIDKGLLKVMSKMGISTYQSLLRRADLRRRRPRAILRRPVLHGNRDDDRGRRPRHHRERDDRAARGRLRRRADAPARARSRRGLRLSHPRRGAFLGAAVGRPAPARGARQCAGQVPRLRPADERAGRAAADDPRPLPRPRRGRGRPGAPSLSTRSKPRRRSSSGSRRERCPTARSRARRT